MINCPEYLNHHDFYRASKYIKKNLQKGCSKTLDHWGPRDVNVMCQEQPALLDPFLEEMVEPLMCAIAAKVRRNDLDALDVW